MSKQGFYAKILAVFCCVFLVSVATADAQKKKPTKRQQREAREHFEQGVELHNEGNYRAALIEFQQAYKLAPVYQLLYNLGQESEELKDYVEAHRNFVQYLQDGEDSIDSDRRAEIERSIARLKKYIASIKMDIPVEGAEVAIDGIVVGVSPLPGDIQVSLGRRKIAVAKEGYAPWERTIDVAGGDEKSVEVVLISLEAKLVADESPPQTVAFWASAGATSAFLVGTGVAVLMTRKAESDYDKERNAIGNFDNPEDKNAAIANAGDKVKRMALLTDIGIGLTVAGAVTTFFLAGGNQTESDVPADSANLQVLVGPTGIGLSGRF